MSKKKTTKKTVVTTTTTTITEGGEGKTMIMCVLDASSSMSIIIDEARDSFNQFIKDQKKIDGDAIVSIARFSSGYGDNNNGYELIRDAVDIQEIDYLTQTDWFPNGMTALNDAIGKGINDTKAAINKMKKSERPDKVLFVIVTDGEENASREFSNSQIKELVKKQEKNDWQFVYLAANQDAFASGDNYGFAKGNTMNFVNTGTGSKAVYHTLNAATANYRTSNISNTRGAVFSSIVDNTKTLGVDDIDAENDGEDTEE